MASTRKNSTKVVVGIKSHSGWAAIVVVAISKAGLEVIDRRRLELVETENLSWAKQPYHAAEALAPKEAQVLIERATKAARQVAAREVKKVLKTLQAEGHEIAGCALLTGKPMPNWTTEQIRSVHVRMHMAEGVLFPTAIAEAVRKCSVPLIEIREKELGPLATRLSKEIAAIGKAIGPPWTADQKNATLAAVAAFGSA